MASLIFSPVAQDNLRGIADWIARDDPQRAASFVAELRSACRDLTTFPRRYPRAPHFGPAARRRTYGNYYIVYEVSDDLVNILAIVHAARDPNAFP